MHLEDLFNRIESQYCCDHASTLARLRRILEAEQTPAISLQSIEQAAIALCHRARAAPHAHTPVHQLLNEFSLSSEEGLALMVLIEALARTQSISVASQLLSDSLGQHDWLRHLGHEKPAFINASALLLLLTGKVMHQGPAQQEKLFRRLLRSLSSPMIHASIQGVIHHVAHQFVFANRADDALSRVTNSSVPYECFSLDMLGEEALTTKRAEQYLSRYESAIRAVLAAGQQNRCSISIKLSALYPRYEPRQFEAARQHIVAALTPLLRKAQQAGLSITIDAEEAHRLELGLCIYTDLLQHGDIADKSLIGMAVQAYSPRALPVLEYLQCFARTRKVQLPIRLVKGAYWDSEIKLAQLQGLAHFPVFRHKQHTDLSYLACAQFMLNHPDCFYPQFATHNAVSIQHILACRPHGQALEFQRLHGMGEAVYAALNQEQPSIKVRVYAPVGEDKELLPYLIRRLLENGANNSFVKQMHTTDATLSDLCRHPLQSTDRENLIKDSADLYLPERENSRGINLNSRQTHTMLRQQLDALNAKVWQFVPLTAKQCAPLTELTSLNPYDGSPVGHCLQHATRQLDEMATTCADATTQWSQTTSAQRVMCLRRFAKALQQHRIDIVSLLVREAGKTIPDAHDELREAIDFAHYYATQAEQMFGARTSLPGPVGEENTLGWKARGPFLCISPWNFPLAIFCGQVCAALACGNGVIAKPSLKTPLIACFVIQLLHESGIPEQALHLALVSGHSLSDWLSTDTYLRGVAFTGSDNTARTLHLSIARREGPRIPLIAETGGQNAMLADCSSLPEQLVKDVVHSAFLSAGQRCSALRVLYLQDEMYDNVLSMLRGHLDSLKVGDPADLRNDIGPLIDHQAKRALQEHCALYERQHKVLYAGRMPETVRADNLLPPHILAVESIRDLHEEQFGPVLHLARYDYRQLDKVLTDIRSCGYGLTFGIHSRNIRWAKRVANTLPIGNVYINRNMVGAIVASQPFGGMGCSGTGPKAGGPHYLKAFACEQSISFNSAALGGSLDILAY